MIWREVNLAIFVFVLCTLAALATVAIYERASSTTTSAWLLLPLFMLIAVAILASELLVKKAGVNDSEPISRVGVPSVTWSPAAAVMVAYVLSVPPAAPFPAPSQQALEAGVVATAPAQTMRYTEQITCS